MRSTFHKNFQKESKCHWEPSQISLTEGLATGMQNAKVHLCTFPRIACVPQASGPCWLGEDKARAPGLYDIFAQLGPCSILLNTDFSGEAESNLSVTQLRQLPPQGLFVRSLTEQTLTHKMTPYLHTLPSRHCARHSMF